MKKKIKILLADDHALFRSGIIELLSDDPSIIIAGEAADGEELIDKYLMLLPDMAVTDISMPKYSGFRAMQEIKKYLPSSGFLFLSMHDDDAHAYQAYKMGADGLLSKNVTKENLISAVRTIYRGGRYFLNLTGPDLTSYIMNIENGSRKKADNLNLLTRTELEVLCFISDGLSSREIAADFGISKRTVDSHRTKICHKLNIKSNCRLISFAVENKKRIKEHRFE